HHLGRAGYRVWPALLLISSVIAYSHTVGSVMHPSYELDDFLPAHERYHNAVIGLAFGPQWETSVGAKYGGATGDTLGYLVGATSMKENYDLPESFYLSTLSQT